MAGPERSLAPDESPIPSPVVTAVLFTCAGQRVDIVSAFSRAGATTIATDVNPLAPALYHADFHALVPRVDDPGYVPALAVLVDEHELSLVVPLTDLDHGVLARAQDAIAALVLLPAPELVDAMPTYDATGCSCDLARTRGFRRRFHRVGHARIPIGRPC